MAIAKKITVPYRRKREGKTNYRKRMTYLKSGKPRLVVRKSNSYIVAQIVEYNADGDNIKAMVHSKELEKLGWNFSKKNIPAAYLTGLLLSKKAKEAKVSEAIADFNMSIVIKGSILFAVLKGAVDGGIDIPCDESIFPSEKRMKGEHIATHFDNSKQGNKFSKYKQTVNSGADITSVFDKVKGSINSK